MEVSRLLLEPTAADMGVNAKCASSTLSTYGSLELVPTQYRVYYTSFVCIHIHDCLLLSSIAEVSPVAADSHTHAWSTPSERWASKFRTTGMAPSGRFMTAPACWHR